MELMEIIKSSLSIFSTISFVFILTSYTIFKIKDRSRIKPYLRVNMQSNNNDFILEEIVQEVKTSTLEKNDDKLSAAQLNQSSVEEDIKLKQAVDLKTLKVHERFKIINPKKPVEQVYIPEPKPEIEKPNKRIRLNSDKKNIYEFYSDTNEKMHKLKLAVR